MNQQQQLRQIIKDLRAKQGMTQKQFAEHCGLAGQQKVSNLEGAIIPIGLNILNRIAKACNATIEVTVKHHD